MLQVSLAPFPGEILHILYIPRGNITYAVGIISTISGGNITYAVGIISTVPKGMETIGFFIIYDN